MNDNDDVKRPGVVEASLAMCAAAGKFAEIVKKHFFHEHPFDVAAAQAALNDVAQALEWACEATEWRTGKTSQF